MFFVCDLFTYLQVKPQECGPGYHEYLEDLLRQKVEGTVQEHGLVIAIEKHSIVDKGKLQEGTGLVLVPVKYTAVLIRMYKNEVCDCVVVEVNKLGFFGEIGAVRLFVSKSSIPAGWKYTEDDGFNGPTYVSSDGSQEIRRESAVRVRILATKQDQDQMLAIGTTDGPYLGPRLHG
eukprot:TRINITY_DN49438_c1_g1_i1.p1 TRINITY_DN49438_c1_g1~~TRINITY_DN49438_c1_g1_i1.p1  ORF type:complete len:176 (-),score=45.72 TRINITY_DN49438_c1_g1_i1:270-797(-)